MAFGWTLFVVPFLFVFSPGLLMKGPPLGIAVDFIAAVAGVWFVAAAMMGYSRRPLGLLARACYAITGVCIFLPADTFGAGRWINAAGVLMGIAIFVRERLARASASATATPVPSEGAGNVPAAGTKDHDAMLEKMGIRSTIEGA
jgi:TRAP-type uncharacterized transport system fused permease subunit